MYFSPEPLSILREYVKATFRQISPCLSDGCLRLLLRLHLLFLVGDLRGGAGQFRKRTCIGRCLRLQHDCFQEVSHPR